ncbi:hypothetical protein TST_0742 [Thermosulfidibacter takaii ABI70S6]|uniref:Uncharacterized protein n=1 Tax=Thermosulfidibacter takaii (strain DSM 17441 / JCM 13301 / NBRC 103674 / ABI70S6) TaxID=1298851 RepID=A0A0S3QT88_THET7|nr:hypothetical protein [Thermosulfidibacter takaii]BAT71547.1 hypothetical protein TST_0742 [Thermosulfidibacter takaii ABI70S6]
MSHRFFPVWVSILWLIVGVGLCFAKSPIAKRLPIMHKKPTSRLPFRKLQNKEKSRAKNTVQVVLPDIVVERIFHKGCKIAVKLKNRGGSITKNLLSRGRLLVRPGKAIPSVFKLKEVDPHGGLLKTGGKVEFVTGLSCSRMIRVEAWVEFPGLKRRYKKSAILIPSAMCSRVVKRFTRVPPQARITGRARRTHPRTHPATHMALTSPGGTGYREATEVNFTAISPTGTGYREATVVNFTAISPTRTGYREATGVNFTAISPHRYRLSRGYWGKLHCYFTYWDWLSGSYRSELYRYFAYWDRL